MRGHQIKLAGSIYRRRNGKFTAVSPPVFDGWSTKRPSLGTFADEEEALEALRKANLEGFPAVPTRSSAVADTTLEAYLERWVRGLADEEQAGRIARSTRKDYEQVVRIHLVPGPGATRVGELDGQRVTDFLGRLRAHGLADRTVQKAYRVLHRALRDSGLGPNPAHLGRRARPRLRTTKAVVRPSVEWVRQFLDHVAVCDRPGARPLLPLWRLMATTGLRRSEALALTWDQVHLDADPATITVVRGLHRDGGGFYVGLPKSRESKRSVGLDRTTAAVLADLRERSQGQRPVRVISGAGHADLDLVFRSERGHSPMPPDRVTRTFVDEWRHAGCCPGPTLHTLRHARGSSLLAAGRPVTEVAAELGHSPAVLLSIYARDLDSAKRHVALAELTTGFFG